MDSITAAPIKPFKGMVEKFRLTLDEGFRFMDQPRDKRTMNGAPIAPPSGLALFQRELRMDPCGGRLRCSCGLTATHFAATRHSNDKVSPFVLNLFAGSVMLTQDHIVPKSLDGSNHVDNMRVMCEPCNRKRGNLLLLTDLLHGALFPAAVKDPAPTKASLADLIREASVAVRPLKRSGRAGRVHPHVSGPSLATLPQRPRGVERDARACWLVNLSLIAREPDDTMATMPLDATLRLSDRAQVRILNGIVHNRSGYVNHVGPIVRRWLGADPIRHEQDLLRSLIDQRPDSKGSIAPPTNRATHRL